MGTEKVHVKGHLRKHLCTTIICNILSTLNLSQLSLSSPISLHYTQFPFVLVEMASKRSCVSHATTLTTPPAEDASVFSNYQFLSQAHVKKYLKLNYKVVHERAFDCKSFSGIKSFGADVGRKVMSEI